MDVSIAPAKRRTWAEINISNAIHNYQLLRSKIPTETKVCCVVKANAYGHGDLELSREYEKLGADFLAVSNIEEALSLRNGGIMLPVLILGYTDPRCAEIIAANNFKQCVFSLEYADSLNHYAKSSDVKVDVHIKLDTGMGRLGFFCDEKSLDEIVEISRFDSLETEGIFTHFAKSDEGKAGEQYTRMQAERFISAVNYLEDRGVSFAIKHCANSAAALDYPEFHFDMVRLGIALYGYQTDALLNKCDLKPVMTLKTVVSHVKTLPSGSYLSYGAEYRTECEAKIATISIGYADGLWRSNYKNRLKVFVGSHSVPIVGRICMDQCMIDISECEDVSRGDEVVVFGLESGHTAADVADKNSTICYEILCDVGARVPRIYK